MKIPIIIILLFVVSTVSAITQGDCQGQFIESPPGCIEWKDSTVREPLQTEPTEEQSESVYFFTLPSEEVTYTDPLTLQQVTITLPETKTLQTHITNDVTMQLGNPVLSVNAQSYKIPYVPENEQEPGCVIVLNTDTKKAVQHIAFKEGDQFKRFLFERMYVTEDGTIKLGEIKKAITFFEDATESEISEPTTTYDPPEGVDPIDQSGDDTNSTEFDTGECNKFGIFTLLQDVKESDDVGAYHGGGGPPLFEEHLGWAHDLAGDNGWVTQIVYADPEQVGKFNDFLDIAQSKNLRVVVRLMPKRECENPPCAEDAEGFWPGVREVEPNAQQFVSMIQALGPNRITHVQIYNEPNGDTEESMSPEAYATLFKDTAEGIKALNPDIKVLNAGFNPGTGNTQAYIDALKANGGAELIDVWASHSYPRVSIKAYEDELALLGREVPVIITETGYGYPPQEAPNRRSMEEYQEGADNMVAHFNEWIEDKRVIGVTPFFLLDPYGHWHGQYDWIDPGAPADEANGWPEMPITPKPLFTDVENLRKSTDQTGKCMGVGSDDDISPCGPCPDNKPYCESASSTCVVCYSDAEGHCPEGRTCNTESDDPAEWVCE